MEDRPRVGLRRWRDIAHDRIYVEDGNKANTEHALGQVIAGVWEELPPKNVKDAAEARLLCSLSNKDRALSARTLEKRLYEEAKIAGLGEANDLALVVLDLATRAASGGERSVFVGIYKQGHGSVVVANKLQHGSQTIRALSRILAGEPYKFSTRLEFWRQTKWPTPTAEIARPDNPIVLHVSW